MSFNSFVTQLIGICSQGGASLSGSFPTPDIFDGHRHPHDKMEMYVTLLKTYGIRTANISDLNHPVGQSLLGVLTLNKRFSSEYQ